MVFEGINRTRAVRTNLGNAFTPAWSVCRDIFHAFVFVNESSLPESVCGQCAVTRRSRRAREHGYCNAGLRSCARGGGGDGAKTTTMWSEHTG